MQADLFGSNIDYSMIPPPGKVTKAEYYVAMSSLQKFIRRGMPTAAKRAALVMHNAGASRLKRRLAIILLEDIAMGDMDATLDILSVLSSRQIGWRVYESLIERMCVATKSRDADDVFYLVREHRAGRLPSGNHDPKEILKLSQRCGYVDDFGQADWSGQTFKENHRRLVEPLLNLGKGAEWLPGNLIHLILLRWDDAKNQLISPLEVKENPRAFDEKVRDGFVSRFGLDGHTRYGKKLIGQSAREHGLEYDDLHFYRFWTQSAALNRRAIYVADYLSWCHDWTKTKASPELLKSASAWVNVRLRGAYANYVFDRDRQRKAKDFM